MDDYILVLVHVDQNHVDVAGNEYPLEGYIEAEKFTDDLDLRYGLLGVPWGKTVGFPYDHVNEGKWIVVKTQISDDIIIFNEYYNQIKFKNGFVLYSGTIQQCAKFIIKNKNDIEQNYSEEAFLIKKEEIAGTKKWMQKHENLLV